MAFPPFPTKSGPSMAGGDHATLREVAACVFVTEPSATVSMDSVGSRGGSEDCMGVASMEAEVVPYPPLLWAVTWMW